MSYELYGQTYGKSRVRLTKVNRDNDVHRVTELSVDLDLQGDFEAAYTEGDNSQVIPTDTIKNTIYAFARELDVDNLEAFSWTLGCHFVESFPHVAAARVQIEQRPWQRVATGGKEHPHLFLGTSGERYTCDTIIAREEQVEDEDDPTGGVLASGIKDLPLMKTTASGFSGFLRDQWTTLRETEDRILATNLTATWNYNDVADDWCAEREAIREILIAEFGADYSPSLQATLYAMGRAVLDARPLVEEIILTMPNEHRVLLDLSPLELDNPNVLFQPIDEPYGKIEASLCRQSSDEDQR